jgi:hypothetical protein
MIRKEVSYDLAMDEWDNLLKSKALSADQVVSHTR